MKRVFILHFHPFFINSLNSVNFVSRYFSLCLDVRPRMVVFKDDHNFICISVNHSVLVLTSNHIEKCSNFIICQCLFESLKLQQLN